MPCTELSLAVAHKFQSQPCPTTAAASCNFCCVGGVVWNLSQHVVCECKQAAACMCMCVCVLLYVQSVVLWPKNPSLACAWKMPHQGGVSGVRCVCTLLQFLNVFLMHFGGSIAVAMSAHGETGCKSLRLSYRNSHYGKIEHALCVFSVVIIARISITFIAQRFKKVPINFLMMRPI